MKKEVIILELSNWWGLGSFGNEKLTITENKIKHWSRNMFPEMTENSYEKVLTEKMKEELKKYIEKNLLPLDSSEQFVMDAGNKIYLNYNNKKIKIINDFELYDKVEKNINKIIRKGDKDEK